MKIFGTCALMQEPWGKQSQRQLHQHLMVIIFNIIWEWISSAPASMQQSYSFLILPDYQTKLLAALSLYLLIKITAKTSNLMCMGVMQSKLLMYCTIYIKCPILIMVGQFTMN